MANKYWTICFVVEPRWYVHRTISTAHTSSSPRLAAYFNLGLFHYSLLINRNRPSEYTKFRRLTRTIFESFKTAVPPSFRARIFWECAWLLIGQIREIISVPLPQSLGVRGLVFGGHHNLCDYSILIGLLKKSNGNFCRFKGSLPRK